MMSLIVGDEPAHTFHVSTGTSSTPTVRGKFRFYMRQPGYNSTAMYYSVYFQGGYATHGYRPRADLPRQPRLRAQPDPLLDLHLRLGGLGMPIYVYG